MLIIRLVSIRHPQHKQMIGNPQLTQTLYHLPLQRANLIRKNIFKVLPLGFKIKGIDLLIPVIPQIIQNPLSIARNLKQRLKPLIDMLLQQRTICGQRRNRRLHFFNRSNNILAQLVKRTRDNTFLIHALIQPFLHLLCRLIRKSQHENLIGLCLLALNQKTRAPHHRTRLASTRTSQYQIIIFIYHTRIALALAQRIALHPIKKGRKLVLEAPDILRAKIFHLLIAPVRHLLHQRKISMAIQIPHCRHLAKLIEHFPRHRPDLQQT